MRVRYIAYGSNLHPERLQRRVPSAQLLGAATLDGWALRFNKRGQDGSGKCNIVPADARVHVAVYDMQASHQRDLDRIEGLNVGYNAKQYNLPGFGRCFFYHASDSHIDDVLAPFQWYKELVLLGCALHGFPAPYIAAIQSLAHVQDHNKQRHDEHMDIVRASQKRGSIS